MVARGSGGGTTTTPRCHLVLHVGAKLESVSLVLLQQSRVGLKMARQEDTSLTTLCVLERT